MPRKRRHEADRAHLGEAAAYTVRNIERDKAVFFGQLDEIALLVVGDGDDVLRPIRATCALSASVTIRYWLIVSAVPPDLLMMQKHALSSR